jgi:uncharacterized protein (DUF2236 family)
MVYERYVAPLSPEDRQSYWDDQRRVGKMFGIPMKAMPKRVEGLGEYVDSVIASGDLFVTPDALATAKDVILKPPLPPALFGLSEAINQTSIGLLPDEVRRLYGFSWDPVRGIALRAGQEYLRRVLVPIAPSAVRHTPEWRRRQDLVSAAG